MRQPIVKDLRSQTKTKAKAKDLTSKAKAKDFIKCPRGASRRLEAKAIEDFITVSQVSIVEHQRLMVASAWPIHPSRRTLRH